MTLGFLTQFYVYKLPTKRSKVGLHCPFQPGKLKWLGYSAGELRKQAVRD